MYTGQPNILRWLTSGSLLRNPLQESCCQVLNEEYSYVHTQLSLLLPSKGALEDPGHVALLSLLPLWFGSFVLKRHSVKDYMECSTPS